MILIIDYIPIFKCKYLLILFYFYQKYYINTFNSFKADYLRANPLIKATKALNIVEDLNDLDIYLEEDNSEIDKLTLYFKERRSSRFVSYIYYSFNLI